MPPCNAASPERLLDLSSRITTAGIILALLYLGREVLIPVTLAVMLSFLLAPLVRALRRIGAGRIFSVLATVVVLTLACTAVAVLLGTQILRIAESLPQYEATVQRKLKTLDEVTIGRLRDRRDLPPPRHELKEGQVRASNNSLL